MAKLVSGITANTVAGGFVNDAAAVNAIEQGGRLRRGEVEAGGHFLRRQRLPVHGDDEAHLVFVNHVGQIWLGNIPDVKDLNELIDEGHSWPFERCWV